MYCNALMTDVSDDDGSESMLVVIKELFILRTAVCSAPQSLVGSEPFSSSY